MLLTDSMDPLIRITERAKNSEKIISENAEFIRREQKLRERNLAKENKKRRKANKIARGKEVKMRKIKFSDLDFHGEIIGNIGIPSTVRILDKETGASTSYLSRGSLDEHREGLLSLLYNVMELTGKPAEFENDSFPYTMKFMIPPYRHPRFFETLGGAREYYERENENLSESLRKSLKETQEKLDKFYDESSPC